MHIQFFSDLHTEFGPVHLRPHQADVVVLAGDIGAGSKVLRWIEQQFPDIPVVYVLGNHEFYGSSVEATWEQMRARCPAHVHVLENQSVVLNGVRFLGCTLWTDFALFGPYTQLGAMQEAEQQMNDYGQISIRAADGKRKLQPADVLTTHVRSRRWLQAELAQPFSGPSVVVTHHAPHHDSVPEAHHRDLLSAAYASDLTALTGQAQLWIHGHTHNSRDYTHNGTRIVCNPRGYPNWRGEQDNEAFREDWVVAV